MNDLDLNQIEKAVFYAIKSSKRSSGHYGKIISLAELEIQFGEGEKANIESAARSLIDKNLVRTLDGNNELFCLTPYGKTYQVNTGLSVNNFMNVNNSNIVAGSKDVTQMLNTSDQPADIRSKIEELKKAIEDQDRVTIKKAFGYIADKSIDVAIALLMGKIIR
jgi:hypothetical protein